MKFHQKYHASSQAPAASWFAYNGLMNKKTLRRPNISLPDPVVEAYKKGVDRTLIRENLKLTAEERLEKLMRLQQFAEELRQGGRQQPKKKI